MMRPGSARHEEEESNCCLQLPHGRPCWSCPAGGERQQTQAAAAETVTKTSQLARADQGERLGCGGWSYKSHAIIHTHEVSHPNRGTLNAVLHMVLVPFRHSDTA